MKLKDYNLEEWDGSYSVICSNDNFKVLLLNLEKEIELNDNGRPNLVAIDDNETIV
jgi:hypothetical protein